MTVEEPSTIQKLASKTTFRCPRWGSMARGDCKTTTPEMVTLPGELMFMSEGRSYGCFSGKVSSFIFGGGVTSSVRHCLKSISSNCVTTCDRVTFSHPFFSLSTIYHPLRLRCSLTIPLTAIDVVTGTHTHPFSCNVLYPSITEIRPMGYSDGVRIFVHNEENVISEVFWQFRTNTGVIFGRLKREFFSYGDSEGLCAFTDVTISVFCSAVSSLWGKRKGDYCCL